MTNYYQCHWCQTYVIERYQCQKCKYKLCQTCSYECLNCVSKIRHICEINIRNENQRFKQESECAVGFIAGIFITVLIMSIIYCMKP